MPWCSPSAGYEVALYSRKAETLDKAMTDGPESLATLVGSRQHHPGRGRQGRSRIDHPTQSVEEAGREADFVMETIDENKDAKTALYAELDAHLPASDTVFASNTSSLNVFELVPPSRQPNTVVAPLLRPGAHHPAGGGGPGSADRRRTRWPSRSTCSRAAGKTPVVMKKFGPGFIVNRIQRAIGETCMDMVQEGLVEPEEIDQAIKATLGIRLPIVGVMQTFDFQGLDMLLAYQKNVGKVYSFVEERVERGALGAKTSKGIYDYQGRSEAEILKKRDELYLKMIDYLTEIGAFEPV